MGWKAHPTARNQTRKNLVCPLAGGILNTTRWQERAPVSPKKLVPRDFNNHLKKFLLKLPHILLNTYLGLIRQNQNFLVIWLHLSHKILM